jgi:hypothetical protein
MPATSSVVALDDDDGYEGTITLGSVIDVLVVVVIVNFAELEASYEGAVVGAAELPTL